MRKLASILFLLALWHSLLGRTQKSIDQLREEAGKASGAHQALIYSELAERLVDQADEQFNQGESVKAHATVREILSAATQAHDQGMGTRRKLKEIEIHLRLTQRHLEAMRRTLAAADRPAVETVEKKLADLRQELLDAMFSPGKEQKKK